MGRDAFKDSFARRVARWVYPAQCVLCGGLTEDDGRLCPDCWKDTPFLTGLTCALCGAGQPGDAGDGKVTCDECMVRPRPWSRGAAALSYRDGGRRVVLSLKHGDRLDLVGPVSDWMARAGRTILAEKPLLVPVPVHWTRLLKRRYNQAAELSRGVAKIAECDVVVDGLIRTRSTPSQDGRGVEGRFANLSGAIEINPKRRAVMAGRRIVLIDDVMASGATLTDCAAKIATLDAEAVNVLVLARAEKTPYICPN